MQNVQKDVNKIDYVQTVKAYKKARKQAIAKVKVSLKFKLKATVIALCMSTMVANTAQAGNFVSDVMDNVLGGMANVTTPGAYTAANRGVLSGGSIYTRSRIFNPQLVTFVPPSFRAGCGGIDLYGGSFSFINSEQLIQLFRSIAANSLGALFQVALSAVSPLLSQVMQKFQDIVQAMNALLKDSCTFSQGLVTNIKAAVDGNEKTQASLSNMFGKTGDVYESFTNLFKGYNTSSPESTVIQNNPDEAHKKNLIGNIVWRALVTERVANHFFSAFSTEGSEILMSVTGTVIIEKPVNVGGTKSADGKNKNQVDDTKPKKYLQPQISLRNFVEGSNPGSGYKKYKCTDGTAANECLKTNLEDANIEGFTNKLYKKLCGVNSTIQPCTSGLVKKLSTNNSGSGADLSADEQHLMLLMGADVANAISDVSIASDNTISSNFASGQFVQEFIKPISLYMAMRVIEDMFNATYNALSAAQGAEAEEMHKQFAAYKQLISNDYQVLVKEYGDIHIVLEKADKLRAKLKRKPTIDVSATGDVSNGSR